MQRLWKEGSMKINELSFTEALVSLKALGTKYRMCCDNAPGVVAWLAGGTLQTNHPIPIDAYLAKNWCLIEDDTVIR
jgi:hypothetical protein